MTQKRTISATKKGKHSKRRANMSVKTERFSASEEEEYSDTSTSSLENSFKAIRNSTGFASQAASTSKNESNITSTPDASSRISGTSSTSNSTQCSTGTGTRSTADDNKCCSHCALNAMNIAQMRAQLAEQTVFQKKVLALLEQTLNQTQNKKVVFEGELKQILKSFITCEILATETLISKKETISKLLTFLKDKLSHFRSSVKKLRSDEKRMKDTLSRMFSLFSDKSVQKKVKSDLWQLRSTVFSKCGTKFRDSFVKWLKIETPPSGFKISEALSHKFVEDNEFYCKQILEEGLRKVHGEQYIRFMSNSIVPNFGDLIQCNELESDEYPCENKVFNNVEAWGLLYTYRYLQCPNEPVKMTEENAQLFCNLVGMVSRDKLHWEAECQRRKSSEDSAVSKREQELSSEDESGNDSECAIGKGLFDQINSSRKQDVKIDYGAYALPVKKSDF